MGTVYRIKQYYTLTGQLDIRTEYNEGFKLMFDRVLNRFLEDYSLTRTEWEEAYSPYGYNCEKCYITFDGKQKLFEIYYYWVKDDRCGAEFGFNSPNNQEPWPDGPTSITGDQWLISGWQSQDSMYINVLEKYEDDGGDPPEIGELIGFSFPHRMNLRSTEPVVDPAYKKNIDFFFDFNKKLAFPIDGCYSSGDLYNTSPPWDSWIFDYEHFLFKGRLANKYKSFSSNSRCIVSQVMYEDEYYRTSSLDIPCIANVYNNAFQNKAGKTVHADREYIISNAMFGTCIAYDEYLPVQIPGTNPPEMNEGEGE